MYKRKKLFILILLPFCVSLKKRFLKKHNSFSLFPLGVSPLNAALCSSMPIICLLQENGPQKKAWKNEEGREERKKNTRGGSNLKL